MCVGIGPDKQQVYKNLNVVKGRAFYQNVILKMPILFKEKLA